MAILNKDMADMGKEALKDPVINDGIGDIGLAAAVPRFLPQNLIDIGICKSQEDLDKTKNALADYRKVVSLTKQKFKMQETAADLALELAKSQNALVAYFAKTVLNQAKSDAELAGLLAALPQMISAMQGTVEAKKEKRVRDFTERLASAGKPKTATATTKKK